MFQSDFNFNTLYEWNPWLFNSEIEKCSHFFIVCVVEAHFILVHFDLKKIKVDVYNPKKDNTKYKDGVEISVSHVLKFLAWRFKNELWLHQKLTWKRKQTTQYNEDCGIMVLKYIICIVTKQDIGFKHNEDDDRKIFAYNIVYDFQNKLRPDQVPHLIDFSAPEFEEVNT